MKKIAYGLSHYPSLMENERFFIDKTPFLEVMEGIGEPFIVFLRPRRFGKSLWVSILEYYYGVKHRPDFEKNFSKTYIGQHPTPLAGQYLILRFDFSAINTSTKNSTFQGYLVKVHGGVGSFLSENREYFQPEQMEFILSRSEPNEMLQALFSACKNRGVPHKIYLLIDEYDHFANEVVAFRFHDFMEMVSRNGYVRKFFEAIKEATGTGVVGRLFITGVSPLTLDSLTSGFNMVKHLSFDPRLQEMMGFTEAQVLETLRNIEVPEPELPAMLEDLKRWYDGYRFLPEAPQHLYNSDMVLYFASEYDYPRRYPRKMLDSNIASDYGKIRSIFRIADREQANRKALEEVLTEGHTAVTLTEQYSFEKGFSEDDFKSLLFYLGFLTVSGQVPGKLLLSIPNQVIRTLYWEYFAALTQEMTNQVVSYDSLNPALDDLVYRNNPRPLMLMVERTLECLSVRDDAKLDEKHLKAIIVSYLSQTNVFFIKSEFETQRKFVDLLLLGRQPWKLEHQFAFEVKHLHKKDAAMFEAKRKEAHERLKGYLGHEEIRGLENLRCWVAVFVGTKLKVVEPLSELPLPALSTKASAKKKKLTTNR